jgi:hypothetical protein
LGTFNWQDVDALVDAIFSVGAEPLICLGYAVSNGLTDMPPGMGVNSATGLPYPDSWAAYCAEWVKHFKQTGKPVHFYEIINEPWMYFGWNDYGKIGNFTALFNAATQAMKTENPNVLLGFDGTNRKPVLNYWLNPSFGGAHQVGADLGFISFHKYDSGAIGRYTDEQMFSRAESFQVLTDPGGPEDGYYGIEDSQQIYYNARGKLIFVINSESCFNAAWQTGTDPKIQQMAGAVWLALLLRASLLEGLNQSVYFTFCSSKSWETSNKPSGGFGFGMINSDDKKPWYPYYVHYMIGKNLEVNDPVFEAVTTDNRLRVLAWKNRDKLNIYLINKSHDQVEVSLKGISGKLSYLKIDETIPYTTPALQEGETSAESIMLNGYTIMLLQQPFTPRKWMFKQWQDGDTNPIKTINVLGA